MSYADSPSSDDGNQAHVAADRRGRDVVVPADDRTIAVTEIVDIPVADLQFDPTNARLVNEGSSQQAIALALAQHQGRRLVNLAAHIVDNGLDPLTLSAVVPTGDRRKRYRVIEGNRRLLAIRALETPALVAAALTPTDQRKLTKLAQRYTANPIQTVTCVLFGSEEDARVWIVNRHTGANEGAGLSEWGSDEKDRYQARHGQRNPAGQVIDFVDKLTGTAPGSHARIITNVGRILKVKRAQERLGIEIVDDKVRSRFPSTEVGKALRRIIDDLDTGEITSRDIYTAGDIGNYLAGFAPSELPNPKKQLQDPVELDDLAAGITRPAPPKKPRRSRKKPPAERASMVPSTCSLNVPSPRINNIYVELSTLDITQYPNAGAVLFRVFLELSVDHGLEQLDLLEPIKNAPLAKRMKALSAHMKKKGELSDQLDKAINKVANSQSMTSTTTFNQFVHNRYVFPKPSELRTNWDELQPFLEALWP